MPRRYNTECPLTFEDAFERFQEVAELYGHLDPVKLYYHKGDFVLTFTEEYGTETENQSTAIDHL